MDLTSKLREHAETVERVLSQALEYNSSQGSLQDEMETRLGNAMRYSTLGQGKRFRPFLTLESASMFDVPPPVAANAAAAVELVHCYSLIHDDLPAMDDDDLRRGHPTTHKAFDEATAILAGDALQALAFARLAAASVPAEARLVLIAGLADAAGADGMVGGQMMDIAAETAETPLTLDQITTLQAGKTGALITWSATAGPRMAQADITQLKTYGDALGLAFQIADDVLDVEGDAATVGKAVGKDSDAGKATFVSLLGLDAAKKRAKTLVDDACDALSVYGNDADVLRDAARFVITRDK